MRSQGTAHETFAYDKSGSFQRREMVCSFMSHRATVVAAKHFVRDGVTVEFLCLASKMPPDDAR